MSALLNLLGPLFIVVFGVSILAMLILALLKKPIWKKFAISSVASFWAVIVCAVVASQLGTSDRLDKLVEDTFYEDRGGKTISEVAEDFEKSVNAITDAYPSATTEPTGDEIQDAYNNLEQVVGGRFGEALTEAGYAAEDVLGMLAEIVDENEEKVHQSYDPSANSDYSAEFVTACEEIGIDTALITKWEKKEDWANGERFRFTYERHSFLVYVNFDKTISSIYLGNVGGVELYKKGYEPYNVDDYLVDEDVAESLIPLAEEFVKPALKYPSTAKFALLDWSYGREGSLYQLKSSVRAKNGFGVEDEIPFAVIFDTSAKGTAKCVYLQINGVVVREERTPAPERAKVETFTKSEDVSDGSFRIIDGELGEYGKRDPKYPEYVDYYLPIGRYNAVNNTKSSVIMIIDEESNDEVSRLTLGTGESGEFEITSGQHIELMIYSDITLTPISK